MPPQAKKNFLGAKFCGPGLGTIVATWAPISWEMNLGGEHRNRTLPLQLGHFSWHSLITKGLRPPPNYPLNGARTFIDFVKSSFARKFISQLHFTWVKTNFAELSLVSVISLLPTSQFTILPIPFRSRAAERAEPKESIVELLSSVSRSCDFAQKWRFLLLLCATFFADCAKCKNHKKWRFFGFWQFYVVKLKYFKKIIPKIKKS